MDCVFCKIVQGEIPSDKLYEDDEIVAFSDVNPQAPVHGLVIPKRHIANISEITPEDEGLIGRMFIVGNRMARDKEVAEKGYRLVMNSGPDGGQAVDHIHLHVLGGRKMQWPPG